MPPLPQEAKQPTTDLAATRRLGAMLGYDDRNSTLLSRGALDLMPKNTGGKKTLLGE